MCRHAVQKSSMRTEPITETCPVFVCLCLYKGSFHGLQSGNNFRRAGSVCICCFGDLAVIILYI